jgi:hypothetical protein
MTISNISFSPLNEGINTQSCGSAMFIPDPEIYPYGIPDPTTATKEEW